MKNVSWSIGHLNNKKNFIENSSYCVKLKIKNIKNLRKDKPSKILEYNDNLNKYTSINKRYNNEHNEKTNFKLNSYLISKSDNIGNLFKSILDKNKRNQLDIYYNEEYSLNFDKKLNEIISEKVPNLLKYELKKNEEKYNSERKSRPKIIISKKQKNSIIISDDESNHNIEHFISLNNYYDNLDSMDNKMKTNYTNYPSFANSNEKNLNFNNTQNSFPINLHKTISTSYGSHGRVNLKSVMKRINNFERNLEEKNESKKISEFRLTPSKKSKKIKKNIRDNKIINLLENNILISKNETYKLPENLLEVRKRLNKEVNKLVNESNKFNFNITNDQILYSLEKTQKSEYTKDIIEKIKIINYFLSTQPKYKFESVFRKHRKIFVIIDGTVVFNQEVVRGYFIDIPTSRYLSFIESKKERLEEFYKFLSRCQTIFNYKIPFKNIFLLNGLNVFDLIEIPDSDKAVFISPTNIFRGIHLFWDNNNLEKIKKKDFKLLKIQECRKARSEFHRLKYQNNYVKGNRRRSYLMFIKKKKIEKKKFKTYIKKKKYLNDQSFTFGLSDKILDGEEKYFYFSEDEEKVKSKYSNFQKKYPTLLTQLIHFNEHEMKLNIIKVKKKDNKKIEKFISKRLDEKTFKGLNILMRHYNTLRAKKYKITLHQNMTPVIKKMENNINEEAKGIFAIYLKKLQLLTRKVDGIILDKEKLSENNKKNSLINKNIRKVNDVTYKSIRAINKYYPDLISMNIPAVLKTFPKLKRNIFYDIYAQYKTLLTICVCINKDLKLIKKGLDFPTFYNCLPQMRSQGFSLAYKIYETLNKLNTTYLNWEDFLQGMLRMKSRFIQDKIDLFFFFLDTDGNGFLSFDEVYEISKGSLQRTLGDKDDNNDNDEVVSTLASYFANLIFQLVDMPIDQEISIEKIREKILEGQEAAGYLEMFICSDSFTNF